MKGREIGLTMPLWTWPEMEKLCKLLFMGKVMPLCHHSGCLSPLLAAPDLLASRQ